MRERVTRLSSYVVLKQPHQVLLCRLSHGTSSPGFWTLPGGGIEFGESPEDAVTREVREETGLSVHRLSLTDLWSDTETYQGRDFHLIRFIYSGSFDPGPLVTEVEGSTDFCRWVDESELEGFPLVSTARRALGLGRSRVT